MLKPFLLTAFLLLSLVSSKPFAAHPKDMQEAKKVAKIIWSAHPKSIYCDCPYDKHLQIDYKRCNYQKREQRRDRKIEWEHIVPVSWFGQHRACWRKPLCINQKGKRMKGRNCCEKIDLEFRRMATDLHNIVPAIGSVNQARSNYRFGEIAEKDHNQTFYGCHLIIDLNHRMVEPRDEIKGLIARAHLYMADTYHFKLSRSQATLFQHWNKTYPPSEWEVQWDQRVQKIQGNSNEYISKWPHHNGVKQKRYVRPFFSLSN